MKKSIQILVVFLFAIIASCSDDDDKNQSCRETNVTMKVNGELQTFQALGYGQNGYVLHLNIDRRSDSPFAEQGVAIILPYKKTGRNIIQNFIYHQSKDGVSFDGDFINGELESNVITNTKNCFYATFSGKLSDGNQEIIITEGSMSYQYETPFDN